MSEQPEDRRHEFERYLLHHGHFPRAVLSIGGGKQVEVALAPRYAAIRTLPYGSTIYIPRSQLIKLIKWMIPLVKRMDHQDFSVEQAMSDYLRDEELHLQELRRQKRQRQYSIPRRRRRRA